MALFKSLRGKRENLPSTKTDGYAYFCTDNGTFWIDYKDENGSLQRKQLNAKDAETLLGASLSTILNSSDTEIPTSKAVLNALDSHTGDTAIHITSAERTVWNNKADLDAGVYTVTASSADGVEYSATVPGIDSLTTGVSFIMVPNIKSDSTAPTLNVNGLGAKTLRRRLSSIATTTVQGYTKTWLAVNKPFSVMYDGTYWIVEGMEQPVGADMYGAVPKATADADGNVIADTYATIAKLQSMLPKVTTINLVAGWGGTSSPYYQDVTLTCCTETSVVDLQPTPTQLASWQDEGLAFTTQSGNGIVRVYVAGGRPSSAISIQVKVQEVVEV